MKKSNKEEFINKSNEKHNHKYDYSLVDYINSKTKVKIICKEHGIFEQTPSSHLSGRNCPFCSLENNKTQINDFINKSSHIHKNKYDYSLVNYKNTYTKVKIICPTHGIFKQKPSSHLNGNGCIKCSGTNKYSTKDFIDKCNKVHNNKYDYSLVNYINGKTKIKIICPIHGVFEQLPYMHLQSYGCIVCKESIGEKIIFNRLKEYNINFEREKSFKDCKHINPLKFDFYLPDYNLCIEFDGKQHFEVNEYFGGIKSFKKQKLRDSIKTEYCKNNNINLLRIPYNDIDDIDNILNSYLN
ncbi:MAG: hypothetical protein WDA02_08030 [Saccharofermentanales bacterium]